MSKGTVHATISNEDPPEPETPFCEDCTYFDDIPPGTLGGPTRSLCRINPPNHHGFPTVGAYDWCGQHKPATTEPEPEPTGDCAYCAGTGRISRRINEDRTVRCRACEGTGTPSHANIDFDGYIPSLTSTNPP